MFVKNLELVNYRNIKNVKLNLNDRLNIFCGKNGQGKTNLAESLYLVFNGKSFRKCKRKELITYDCKKTEIHTNIILDDNLPIEVSIEIEENKKDIKINGKNKKNFENPIYKKSFFLNSDLLFYCKNFASYRVALLDKLCYLKKGKNFLIELYRYKRVIKQLKSDKKSDVWLRLLRKQSKIIYDYRMSLFNEIYNSYKENIEALGIKDLDLYAGFKEKFEFDFKRNDKKDLSLGELKTAIFALILSTLSANSKNSYILIIDDFNSEWDNDMLHKILEVLYKGGIQSFVMSSEIINTYPHFVVDKGEIRNYE
jgi:DNA replication and repair protein RecF